MPLPRIPDLQQNVAIVDREGRPTPFFQRYLNTAFRQIVETFEAAGLAQSTAEASIRELARLSSYPDPTNVLSSVDAGSGNSTITIADHTRVYPVQGTYDVDDVPITGGNLTVPNGQATYVYYDDTTLADPTPTFVATTDAATAQQGTAPGRHLVGFITAAGSGGPPTGGGGVFPPGGGGGYPLP